MPQEPSPKPHRHPFRDTSDDREARPNDETSTSSSIGFAELCVTTNYTFLTGAGHPEEMVEQAAAIGHRACAIADLNTLAGIVRAHVAAEKLGIPLAVGSRIRLSSVGSDGSAHPDVLLFAASRAGYSRLSRLITLGKRRAPKGECEITLDDLLAHHEGLLAVVPPDREVSIGLAECVGALRDVFDDDRLSIAVRRLYTQDDDAVLARWIKFASSYGVPLVASNDARYPVSSKRELHDVLACIRAGCTLDEAGWRLCPHGQAYLKDEPRMRAMFPGLDHAIVRSVEVAMRAAAFSMNELKYEYPAEVCPTGITPTEYLKRLTYEGAASRYGRSIPEPVRAQIEYELKLIAELQYEAYFLTCQDIVAFARGRGILCQGRGGAANSAVCYCLGITEVDPHRFNILFERFISRARNEPPDIDIDFEHERREEVIQYIYAKYGRERAALAAAVISYLGKSAVREVGKALGFSLDAVNLLSKQLGHWSTSIDPKRIAEAGFRTDDPIIERLLRLSNEIAGFPRHLSQHVGGFVITKSPLADLVPIENAAMEDRTVIEWDKDDIDAMGMLKIDVLGLGMLSCIRKAIDLVNERRKRKCGSVVGEIEDPALRPQSGVPLTHQRIARNPTDPRVYDMLCRADSVGVFQVESRAQMSMLPRLRPRCFYDLVIEVAIVRPGPIQGDMVHPYLRRRAGEESVVFPNEDVRRVLGRTLGVPLFQEQAMELAIVAAGFTPDESDALRRAMAAWKRKGKDIERFGVKLIEGMTARGYAPEFAQRCFEQIKGFSEYGFPESHAASFAILVYVSSWLKCFEPAAFAAALINSQPMGFYAPAQIVRDAMEHGVEIRPVDVSHSRWDCTLETPMKGHSCLRLGMRLVKGLREDEANRISDAMRNAKRPITSVERLWKESGVSTATLRTLAKADAFTSMNLDRRRALWEIKPLREEELPLFGGATVEEEAVQLPQAKPGRRVLDDYESVGLSLKAHPVSFLRRQLESRGVVPCAALKNEIQMPSGRYVSVAGIVLVRQRPGTASGVVFLTVEDETGIANLILWSSTFERFRSVARLSTSVMAYGRVERRHEVVHVHVERLECMDGMIPGIESISRDFH